MCGSQLGHRVGFDEVVVRGGSGHDDARSDTGSILANAFQHSLSLFGRRRAISFGGRAEDNNGVEVGLSGVVGGKGNVVDCNNEDENENYNNQTVEGRF